MELPGLVWPSSAMGENGRLELGTRTAPRASHNRRILVPQAARRSDPLGTQYGYGRGEKFQ